MASSKKTKASGGRSSHEKFEMVTVHRSQLKDAPYNPRVISDRAKQLIRDNIRKVGLVQPIIWNKRTGNIVGGHQRIAALDSAEGGSDYTLTVAQVDLDAKTEKEQNVFLNNSNAMGDFNIEALEKMLAEDVNLENAGFSQAEVYQLFGDAVGAGGWEIQAKLGEQAREAHERYHAIANGQGKKRDGDDFFVVLVFKDREHREEFSAAVGQADNRYLDGAQLLARFKALESASPPVPATK